MITKRELAVRFVSMIGKQPLEDLTGGLIAAATEAGYTKRDIPALVVAVEHELRLKHGAVDVKLTTAHELPAATLGQIANAVAGAAGAEHATYSVTVDPELLGGFEAEADGVAIRDSVRSHIANLTLNSGVTHG